MSKPDTGAPSDGVTDVLRVALTQAGAVDPDVAVLIDRSKVQKDEAGALSNVPELVAALREAKPYLFGSGAPKKFDQMTAEEKRQFASKIGLTSGSLLASLGIDRARSGDPRPGATASKMTGKHIDQMTPKELRREAQRLGLNPDKF